MYDIDNNKSAVRTFSTLFTKKANDIHNFNTRYATSGKFFKKHFRTNIGKNFIENVGIDVWNSIPQNIRQSGSKESFAKAFKKFIISKY